MSQSLGKILVVFFHNLGFPLRKTNEQMVYCFERYSNHKVFFLNLARGVPSELLKVDFDLIIFHDLLLCKRSLPRRFGYIRKISQPLKKLKGYRIATVQDEFTQTTILNSFINEFEIQHIFSVSPPSEWEKIYPDIDRRKVKIDFGLTGYLDEAMIERVDTLSREIETRTIDIGYRAANIQHALGFIGYLKVKITDVFKEASKGTGLVVDVSNEPKDTILGENWYKFLLSCKYTLGVESGASILDHDGSIEERVSRYLKQNPHASFDEVAKECFSGRDGELKLQVMGPRHLEACVTKTCQILTEGDYNGILKPYIHYIPVKKDFSNVKEVLEIVKKDELRSQIVERAYSDFVASKRFSFKSYVSHVLEASLGTDYQWSHVSENDERLHEWLQKREVSTWRYVKYRSKFIASILKLLPKKALSSLIGFMKRPSHA